MKQRAFNFEVRDLIALFTAAYDQIIIGRFNKSQTEVDRIQVKYLYAPKQRVMHDLINKAQTVVLPAVSISIAGMSRDSSRVFNKILGATFSQGGSDLDPQLKTDFLQMPIPVNLRIKTTFYAKFQADIDQMLSNFMPYNNPYIIISMKVPTGYVTQQQEIRIEVQWSGDIGVDYPIELQALQTARITADTEFTVKGWIFPAHSSQQISNIFEIDCDLKPTVDFSLYDCDVPVT